MVQTCMHEAETNFPKSIHQVLSAAEMLTVRTGTPLTRPAPSRYSARGDSGATPQDSCTKKDDLDGPSAWGPSEPRAKELLSDEFP